MPVAGSKPAAGGSQDALPSDWCLSSSYCGKHGRVPAGDVHRGCPAGAPAVAVEEAEGKGGGGTAAHVSGLWVSLGPGC